MAPPRNSGERRPRGRPQRLPHDDTPIESDTFDGNKRLAWLIATTRLLGHQTRNLNRADFVNLMRARGVRIDSSRISRWESGLEYLAPRLVRAYEEVAGLPAEQLGAVRRALARSGQLQTRPTERGEPPDDPNRIDELLDGLESQQIRGDRWLWLADQLRRYQSVYLHRKTWQDLADQLVDELARSATIPYLARYEAAAALMNAPHAQPYLTRSVGRYVLDPQTRVITPVLAVLAEIEDKAASDLVLRLMSASNANLRRSAAIVASSMLRRGHLEAGHKVLEVHVGHELANSPGQPSVVTLDLAARLTDGQFERVLIAAGDEVTHAALRQARTHRELVDADQARTLADHIGLHAELLCARTAHDPDLMLRRLVREALFHVHRERRHLASVMLLASPYASSVGEVALRLTAHADERLAALCWSLVARMTPALGALAILERLEAEPRPGLRARAATALMWARPPLPDDAVKRLVLLADGAQDDHNAATAAVLALGLAGRGEELARIAQGGNDHIASLARWAAERGPAVQES